MNDETHRFFRFSNEQSYDQLTAAGNAARNLPDGNGTAQVACALWSDTFLRPRDQLADKLYCIKRSLILDTDDFDRDGIEELNLESYLERLHWEPPVEEDLEMADELDGILEFVEPE
jgi:hypothetical protein